MNLPQPLLLFTVAAAHARVAYVIDIEAADLLGCWDDQFIGTASTHLLITARTIVSLHDWYPPAFVHEIMCVETKNDQEDARGGKLDALGVSFVTVNGPNSTYPHLFSDFDMTMLPSNGDAYPDHVWSNFNMMLASNGDDALVLYYCLVSRGDVSKCGDRISCARE